VIRVGLGDLSIAWFADLMVALQKELPRVAYEIDMDLSINLRHKLELGNLDVAVITGRLEDTHLVTAPLEPTRFVWAAAPSLVALRSQQARRRRADAHAKVVVLAASVELSTHSPSNRCAGPARTWRT
jgi:DNA-binding transcriptional LysR family regulator